MVEPTTWSDLSELVNDGQLLDVHWDATLGHVRLSLAVLRRADDGSSLDGQPVDLTLSGVAVVAIAHAPRIDGIRPSEYRLKESLAAA